jgi:tetratricopeptide (TPR) repeat protein
MTLIYGNYYWARKDQVAQRAYCSLCNSENRPLRSYTAREVGHVYWIPLMPWGRRRIVRHCLTCKQFYIFRATGKKLEGEIEAQRELIYARIGSDPDVTVADVSTLAHLGDFEGVQRVIQGLDEQGDPSAALARAWVAGLRENADEAREQFDLALATMDLQACVRYWLSRFLFQQKQDEEACEQLDQAATLDSRYDDVQLLQDMIQARKHTKDWDNLAVIMNHAVARRPKLGRERWFAKLHTKACRKSGRPAEGTWPHARIEPGP